MASKAIIVESPTKARTISRIVGKDYVVKASNGHIRDLPKNKLGVDVDNGFQPEYVTIKGKSKILKELRETVNKTDEVLLGPDPGDEASARGGVPFDLVRGLRAGVVGGGGVGSGGRAPSNMASTFVL